MISLKIAALAGAAVSVAYALTACETSDFGSVIDPQTGAQAEIANAGNLNSNGSVQPGRAGPSPFGGDSNPGTSGSISPKPGPPPR
jgi:hypothetical protein